MNFDLKGDIELIDGPIKLESIKVLYGANYFSGDAVVRLRINLGGFNEIFTNQIPGFFERLQTTMPSLYEHHCSPGKPGGFFERVIDGTLIGHVLEHVTIEIQTLAGMDVGFGKTRITKKAGVYNVVFRFFDEIAGIYAGKASLNFINSILLNLPFEIKGIINTLKEIRDNRLLGFSTQAIVDEAKRRNIPYLRLDKYNLVQLGTGKYRKIIRATITGRTSLIAVETTDNKVHTNSVLDELGVPVPEKIVSRDVNEIISFQKSINKPIVIKPIYGSKGRHVSIGLTTEQAITSAFNWAIEPEKDVIAQEFIDGDAYRVLVIDHKFVAAVRLEPPKIIGDGKNTISQLIEKLNQEPGRDIGDKGKLSFVEIDEDTLQILRIKGYPTETVLQEGEALVLKNSENPRLGGKSYDVTDIIHPYNKFVCERISKIVHLDVTGVDIITRDISIPVTENNGKIIEVNSAPDFKMHIEPTFGEKRDVQKQFIDMLFPKRIKPRVPIVSITGSRGKTLATEIICKGLMQSGLLPGMINSKGLFIGDNCLKSSDLIDVKNEHIILKDPTIDCAVFEVPVETILEYGLGYEFADVGVVLSLDENISDYYKYDHIRDVDDIAYAKSVVAEQVYDNGHTILNADNELIFEMTSRLYSKPVLITKTSGNKVFYDAAKKGGSVYLVENNNLIHAQGGERTIVCNLTEFPILSDELQNYNFYAIIASIATLRILKVPTELILKTIKNFI